MFNGCVYAYMRKWYCPDTEGLAFEEDTWFKFKAMSVNGVYTPIHASIELTAMVVIGDDGQMIRAVRMNLNRKIPEAFRIRLEREAFDVTAWEEKNGKQFPYANMFNGGDITRRYGTEHKGSSMFFSTESKNTLMMDIKKKMSGRPCNCGK